MSGAWSNNSSFQQAPPGQVKLFDPTQFQTPLSTPSSGANTNTGQAVISQPAQPAQPSHNSWNSWGSWDWNSENSGSGQGAAVASSAGGVSDQQQLYSGHSGQVQGHIPQYSQAWNQSWDGAGTQQQSAWDNSAQQSGWGSVDQQHYQQQQQQQQDWGMAGQQSEQQYPAYDQPGVMNGPTGQQNFQQHYQHIPQETLDQNHYGAHQFYNGQFYGQQPAQQFPFQQQAEQSFPPQEQGQSLPPQQQQEQNVPPPLSQPEQSFLPQDHPNTSLASQQQQEYSFPPQQDGQLYNEEHVLSHEGAAFPIQNSLDQAQHHQFQHSSSVDQGQQQQQLDQQEEEAPATPQPDYYDQPYDASSWAPTSGPADPWGHSEFQASGVSMQPNSSQNDAPHSEPGVVQAATSFEQPPVLIEQGDRAPPPQQKDPVLDAFNENDNDGTVSGFFGRDDDGDIPAESPRLGRWGDSGNQLPVQQQSFHRTHSDISNASLMTLNFPQGEGDEDDGDPLHHVQELVQRMEATHLARVSAEAAEGIQPEADITHQVPGGFGDSAMALGHSGDFGNKNPPVSSSGDQVEPQAHRGDYSGFGGGTSDFNTSNKPEHPNLPLDTNLRPGSPDGEDQPGSGGSGASGGSSGLADWEMVPSQVSSGHSHSGNSSLDNGVSGTGGGFFSDKPDGGVAASNNNSGAATISGSDFSTRASGDGLQSTLPPISDASLPLPLSDQPKVGQGDGRADASSSVHQHQTPDTQHPVSTGPPPPMLSVPPPGLPPQGGDVSSNPFRRDGNKSPRHASLAQPTSRNTTMPPPPPPASTNLTSQQHQDKSQGGRSKEQGLSALPSRPKPPQVSSEDGIPARRRETDQLARQYDRGAGRKPGQDSSTSSQDRPRHHSAFHPVNRPRMTTMSPATTLWDQEDTSSSNILLAPAVPLIIPAMNPYSTSAAATATSDNDSRNSTANKHGGGAVPVETPRSRDKQQAESKSESRRGGGDRREEDPNRSFDSLDEINDSRGSRDRSYKEQRERDERYRQDTERDRPSSRVDRPQSRSGGQYHYDRDRPSSRVDYARDDPYRRNRSYYRDYGDVSYDERYDRPRSRQDESRGSRPASRTGQQEVDRPRSRANYDRDREYYGQRDKHRGYGYDAYGRQGDYSYDERDRYYRYYRDREARYARGYYEEYYGAKQAEQYLQQRQQQQQQQQPEQYHRPGSQAADRSSNHSRQSRAGSRGNTPGVGAPSPGPDYYGRQGSRPVSRADYNRDYYYKGYDYSGYYYDGYGYDPYAYGYGYPGYEDSYNQSYEQGRLTPPKYTYPHTRACFGPGGQLVKVLPNRPADGQPALVEVQDVQTLLQACPEAEELRQFPGPLTRVNTHKKDVLLFCQLKAKECSEDVSMTDRESAQLIWRLLELLIKQNGAVVGTDLSDLLLEGHEPSTHEYALHGLRITQSQSPVVAGADEDRSSSRGGDSPALRVTQDRTVITQAASANAEREAWIDRFRHLLLYGRKKDALECAMKNNLWGHALFLASKMDSRAHANVMTRFANNAMRMNDPLQTLYQLMSNRQPAAVTCVSDERWGDWRPHLAMMLSNQTSRSDLDRKSICTLGDTLASKGFLHASHFCYLMAQVTLGTYHKKTSKVVLVGSSHTLTMDEFATTEAIQCTEVYEYAQLLGNQTFCLPHFQIYKYLYACRLADYGMIPEALHYCEVISNIIQQYPTWFKPAFVKLVYQLSSKLKFSDPQRLHTSLDAQDPLWIQQLSQISAAFDDGSLQPVSGAVTPANVLGGTTTSSESGDYGTGYYGNGNGTDVSASLNSTAGLEAYSAAQQQQQQAQADTTGCYSRQHMGTDSVDSSQVQAGSEEQQAQQQEQLYQQQQQQQQHDPSQGDYSQQQQQWGDYSGQWQQEQQGYQSHAYSEQQQHHYYQHQQQQQPHEGQTQQELQSQHHHHHHQHHPYYYSNQQQQQQQQQQPHVGGKDVATAEQPSSDVTADDAEERSSIGGGSQLDASSASSTLYSQGYGTQQQEQQQQQQQHHQFQQFPHGGLPPRASITTNETTEDEQADDDDDEDDVDATASGFDYFGNIGQVQKVVAPPHRYRSQSGSSSTGGRRRRTTSGSSTGSVKAAPNKMAGGGQGTGSAAPSSQSGLGGGDEKKPGQQGSGWFGGLFSKFGRKGKNEMILPDDKDPAIVWDPAKKKWVNADGTEDETHSAAPPPTDLDLMGNKPVSGGPPTSNMSGPPSSGAPPPMAPAAGANRFSLKAKGARNQYVDVNNPKPLAVPSNLFNVMPGAAPLGSSATPQVLMPGAAPMTETPATDTNNSSQGLLSVPETSDQLSRTSSMSSLSHEVSHFMTKPPVADMTGNENSSVPKVPQMPMMFNPASLKGGAQGQGHPGSAGPGLKYGQRRAYPK